MSKRLLVLSMTVFAAFAMVAAQQADERLGPRRKSPAVSPTLAENQIRQLEEDWGRAYITHDLSALETILADDWTYSPADGSFKTAAQVIEDFRVDTMKYESIDHADEKFRVYGNAAVVTGEETVHGNDGGREIQSHVRFTDVFVKRNDRWQAVASHESTIPEPEAGANPN